MYFSGSVKIRKSALRRSAEGISRVRLVQMDRRLIYGAVFR